MQHHGLVQSVRQRGRHASSCSQLDRLAGEIRQRIDEQARVRHDAARTRRLSRAAPAPAPGAPRVLPSHFVAHARAQPLVHRVPQLRPSLLSMEAAAEALRREISTAEIVELRVRPVRPPARLSLRLPCDFSEACCDRTLIGPSLAVATAKRQATKSRRNCEPPLVADDLATGGSACECILTGSLKWL